VSLLDSICEWAQTLPGWQGDAVRRLLTQDDVTEKDRGELLCMLKLKYGLPVEHTVQPLPLKKGDISGAPSKAAKVTLKVITDLQNVNKIPDGSQIPFGDAGLTVLYGENGTGKSGYARVLKRACRARDTKEQILPNVFGTGHKVPAKATFIISVEGHDQPVIWTDGQQADDILTNISVFDSKCARVIVDEKNELFYLPYGAHVFSGLARVLGEIKEILQSECPSYQTLEYPDIPAGTKAAEFMSRLSMKTTDEQIIAATAWSAEDDVQLKQLSTDVAKAEADDPIQQAKRIRTAKITVAGLRKELLNLHSLVSDDNETGIKESISRLNSAIEACKLVKADDFSKEPLQGVGTSAWKRLYEAAKEYSVNVAYRGEEFPVVGDGKVCVWCMQELDKTAKERLTRFKKFMEDATQTELKAAKEAIQLTLETFKGTAFKAVKVFDPALDEIGAKDPELRQLLEEQCLPVLRKRAASFIRMLRNAQTYKVPSLIDFPTDKTESVEAMLEEEAKKLEKIAKPEELEKLKKQLAELQSRRLMSQRRAEIVGHRNNLILRYKYLCCIVETDTTQITRRGRELVSEGFTPGLKKALNDELTFFGAGHLPINLRQFGERGTTQLQILLDGCRDNSIALTRILSEGEQKALALAGFLAELKVGQHTNPIVFDDPVCSLDHRYREKVAERLAAEAVERQIVIFTHDIAFLLQLGFKAADSGASISAMTIQRRGDYVGHCVPDLPWHALSVKKRLGYLRNMLNSVKGLYDSNLDEYNQQAAIIYNLLRETWEAFVEEVLLNQTVIRHRQDVQTQRLKPVAITNEDYKMVDGGMTKCSLWMLGHDKSKALDVNRPDPKEVLGDINDLDEFRKAVIDRADDVRRER